MNRALLRAGRLIVAAILPLAVGTSTVLAGSQDGAVVVLHAGPHLMKGDTPCDYADGESWFPCRDFRTTWPLNTPANVYLVVAQGNPDPGVAGLSCGILYNNGETGHATMTDGEGVDLFSWSPCASGLYPVPPYPDPDDFPASGGGHRMTWNAVTDCQTAVLGNDGVHTVAGSFYVFAYSDDVFEITPNRTIADHPDEFQVGDCDLQLTDLPYPEAAGAVAFGTGTGYNPCQAVPVRPTTWSRLKIRYGGTP